MEQRSPTNQPLHSKAMTVGLETHERMLGDHRCFPFGPGFSRVIEDRCVSFDLLPLKALLIWVSVIPYH